MTSPKDSVRIINKWGKWFYVLPEFLDVCPGYKKMTGWVLLEDKNIGDYLHNLEGPSRLSAIGDVPLYYINGKRYNKKEWEALAHNIKFGDKLENLLDD